MDASVTIGSSMDQSSSKRGCRANNNVTNTLKKRNKSPIVYVEKYT